MNLLSKLMVKLTLGLMYVAMFMYTWSLGGSLVLYLI